jgi:signal transduction histidine kinase
MHTSPLVARPKFFRTTAFRWVLRSCVAFLVSSALLFGFIYWQTAGRLKMQFDAGLLATSRRVETIPRADLPRAIGERIADDPMGMKLAGLFDARGRPVAGNVLALPSAALSADRPHTVEAERLLPDGSRQANLARIVIARSADHTVVLGDDLTEVVELRELILHALLLGVLPAIMLGLAAGAAVSTYTVQRLERMSEAARGITAGRLDQRLPRDNSGDDLDQIAGVVNAMLGDVERLMQEVKTAGDAIAHDLRTPLTRLRNRLEHAAGRGGAAAEQALDGAVAEIDTVVATLEALLRIGEIERGRRRAAFAPFDASVVAEEAAELFAPIAEDRGVGFRSEITAADMHGDRNLIFELLSNLLDNAIKYTPPGGCVVLRVGGGGTAFLEVEDDGPGIAAEEREYVLRRFYRCDRARRKHGSGLGLSLVSAIAQLHGLRLSLEPGAGGGLRARVQAAVDAALPERVAETVSG